MLFYWIIKNWKFLVSMDLSLLYNPATESMNVIQLGLYGIVFPFLMVTLFDTTGTMLAWLQLKLVSEKW